MSEVKKARRTSAMRLAGRGSMILVTLVLAEAGYAQNSGAASASGAEAGADDALTITVVARKRVENVQDVPISVSALSGTQVADQQIKRVADLAASVPNMTVDGNGNVLGAIGLRGVVSETRNLGFDSGLGVYVDGVLTTRPTENNQELPDIASVEVLRGPQGTLFGRNTTAGAINIITRRPSSTFTADFALRSGSLGTLDVDGYVSGPVSPTLAVKLSGYDHNTRGYIYNETLNTDANAVHHRGGRAGLLWKPEGNLEVQASAYYTEQRDSRLFGQLKDNSTGALAGLPGIFADPYRVQQNTPSYQNVYSAGGNVRFNWQTPGGFTLTAISGYGWMKDRFLDDDDARPIDVASSNFRDSTNQFTQEVRLASPTGGNFDYLVGAYYLHQKSASDRATMVNAGFVGYITDVAALKTDAYAVFISANYRPTSAIEIAGGLRYNGEKKNVDFHQTDTSIIGLPTLNARLDRTDNDPTGNASITYKISRRLRVYGSVSRGFKSGGFNADIVGDTNIAFAPEHVWAYEVGLKSEPFGGKAHFNVALFQSDFTDLQVSQLLANAFQLTNAGAARIRGVEAEFIAEPVKGLEVRANAGYLDPTFRKFDSCGVGLSCAGSMLPFVAKWTLSAGAGYRQQIGANETLHYRVDWSYKSHTFAEATNAAPGRVAGYGIVNARVALGLAGGRYEIGLWAKNLLDKRYQESAFYLAPYQQWKVTWAPPRTYGLDVAVHY